MITFGSNMKIQYTYFSLILTYLLLRIVPKANRRSSGLDSECAGVSCLTTTWLFTCPGASSVGPYRLSENLDTR